MSALNPREKNAILRKYAEEWVNWRLLTQRFQRRTGREKSMHRHQGQKWRSLHLEVLKIKNYEVLVLRESTWRFAT